jgi:hypothetical protein
MPARANIHWIGLALMVVLSTSAASAAASGGTAVCVPSAQNKPLVTPKAGACKPGYALTELGAEGKEGKEGKQGPEGKNTFSESEITTIKSILPFIKFVKEGVAGKPTIQFSGVNVQVVSGAGKTNAAVNGEGNLVIGYDENVGKHEQTGSHDLILGEEQTFTSFAGLVAGLEDKILAQYAFATGFGNTASGEWSSVTGGNDNVASGPGASISGGDNSFATAISSSVSGGGGNAATAVEASVSGGNGNGARAAAAAVSGGKRNSAKANYSSIFGGKEQVEETEFGAIP